jgi:PAS domain S-box-containing protein
MVPDRDGSGETAWFTFSYGPVRDETGAVAGVFCSAIETSDMIRAHQALQASDERELRLIIDNIPALIGFIDRDLRYRFVNEEMARFVGRSVTEFGDLTLPEVVGERVYERLRPGVEKALSGTAVQFDDVEPDKYGPGRHGVTQEHYIPRVGDDGAVEGYYFLAVDVSERRRVEAELRRSEERLRRMINVDGVGILVFDMAGSSSAPTTSSWPPAGTHAR